MANRRPIVVGIGEILWDMLPGGKQLGGAPTNFAYDAQAMEAEAYVVSCIGEDALGREIQDRLSRLGMSCRYLAVDPSHPTGTVDVTIDAKGVPTFIIREEVAWDFIPSGPHLLELAKRADAVCFGSLAQRSDASRAVIRAFLDATRGDCLRIFDINLRQACFTREIVETSLRRSCVLKLNDGELSVLANMLDIGGPEARVMDELSRRYRLRVIALTRGDAGSRLYVDGRCHDHPGYTGPLIDTVGAGDSFTAALTIGLLRGDAPEVINERANRLASFVCSQAGATPPIPSNLLQ